MDTLAITTILILLGVVSSLMWALTGFALAGIDQPGEALIILVLTLLAEAGMIWFCTKIILEEIYLYMRPRY